MSDVDTRSNAPASAGEIVETLSFLDDWEDRYRFIIDLGKQLPHMSEAQKREDLLVRGCQSQVWLDWRREGERLRFTIDSDAHIVRGLVAMVLAVYDGRTAAEIRDFDIDAWFASLDLLKHLSPTRGNGLRAMVQRIRDIAAAG